MQNLPFREDGTIDLVELGRRQIEAMVNRIMDLQADELCGEGNRRNGYRERGLLTPVGEITLRIPKLREGTYFPDELIRPYSRVNRAMVAIVKEADALAYLDFPREHHIRLRTNSPQFARACARAKRRRARRAAICHLSRSFSR
jgi:hypothetical protein